MQIGNIGILSPGDMGQAVAIRLRECGFAVHAALDGRSARTRALATEAGIADCGSLERLVAICDLVLSVLNPAEAVGKARETAAAMRATGRRIAYADCNAVAPQTAIEIDAVIRGAGGRFVDAGIVGSPPRGGTRTRVYVSGPDAGLFGQIDHPNLEVRNLGDRVGDASAVKMCYGALTKGAVALGLEFMMAARKLGVYEALDREMGESTPEVYRWMLGRLPLIPPKAYRWVPEMLEIARTFEGVGMTPRILQGAAEVFGEVAVSPLGRETPEQSRALARSGHDVVEALAALAENRP